VRLQAHFQSEGFCAHQAYVSESIACEGAGGAAAGAGAGGAAGAGGSDGQGGNGGASPG
jgi:hypothetical protein